MNNNRKAIIKRQGLLFLLGMVFLILVGCGTPATPTPILSTPTPASPTIGHWEGDNPLVSFDINSDGSISNFEMIVELTALDKCTLDLELTKIEADNSFAITLFAPYETLFSNLSDAERKTLEANNLVPTPMVIDTGEVYKRLDINGNFASPTTVSGTFVIMWCEDRIYYKSSATSPVRWKAEWKSP